MSNKKEEKWVTVYDKYKNMDFDTIIAKKEEKGEDASKFKSIKENLPKIENLKNYLDKLNAQKDILEEQKKLVEDIKAAPDKMKDMEEKLSAIEAENKKLEEEIKAVDIAIKVNKDNPEEKAKLEEKRKNLMKEYGDNQTKYSKYQDIYTGNRNLLAVHAGQKLPSSEEIEGKLSAVNEEVDKCNIICSELVEGKNMSEIMPTLQEKYDKKVNEKRKKENITEENITEENVTEENETEENETEENVTEENETEENEAEEEEPETKKGIKNWIKKALTGLANMKFIKIITDPIKNFIKKQHQESFLPTNNTTDTKNIATTHEEETRKAVPKERPNVFRDNLVVAETKKEDKKTEVKSNMHILENQLLEAIAECGEKSDKAQKIASQIKLQKYVQEKSGVTIGTKSDVSRYETEQFQALAKNSGMKEALAKQDTIAVGRAYLPKENNDEGR